MNLPTVIKVQAVKTKLPDLIKVSNKIYKVKE